VLRFLICSFPLFSLLQNDVKLEQNPEKNEETRKLQDYINQQYCYVNATIFALKHSERGYVYLMQRYYTTFKYIAMHAIKNNEKIRIANPSGDDTLRNCDPMQSLCETAFQIETQYYFLDRIGWWNAKP